MKKLIAYIIIIIVIVTSILYVYAEKNCEQKIEGYFELSFLHPVDFAKMLRTGSFANNTFHTQNEVSLKVMQNYDGYVIPGLLSYGDDMDEEYITRDNALKLTSSEYMREYLEEYGIIDAEVKFIYNRHFHSILVYIYTDEKAWIMPILFDNQEKFGEFYNGRIYTAEEYYALCLYQPAKVTIEGKEIECENAPFYWNGGIYLPLRDVYEAMGYSVLWQAGDFKCKGLENAAGKIEIRDSDDEQKLDILARNPVICWHKAGKEYISTYLKWQEGHIYCSGDDLVGNIDGWKAKYDYAVLTVNISKLE